MYIAAFAAYLKVDAIENLQNLAIDHAAFSTTLRGGA
jgi:hypothetical protein